MVAGRYAQIPIVTRLCHICESKQIEHESHILVCCVKYSILRDELYSKIEIIALTFTQLSPLHIEELLTSTNHCVNIQLVKFISCCFDLGSIILSTQTDVN